MRIAALLLFACSVSAQSVWFEPNVGQVAGKTEWIGRSRGAYLYLKGDEVVYANGKNVHMRLVGANAESVAEKLEPTGGYSNYFIGRDEKTWFTGIPHYAKLRYTDVYPGIDIVYYASGQNVEYDFAVRPGADSDRIELAFSEPVGIDNGDLIVAGLRQHKPRVLQDGVEVAAEYRITEAGHVSIALADYDHSRELTVDPVLEFSTFLGGPGDDTMSTVAVDKAGFVYVAGYTATPSTPILDPFQQPNQTFYTPVIFKFSADGQKLIYYTVLLSNSWGFINDMALDTSGRVIVIGGVWSTDFPLKNPLQTDYKSAYTTGFITRFAPDGKTIDLSTYFGGTLDDRLMSVGTDSDNNIWVGGYTRSMDFPSKNAFMPRYGGGYYDCFLSKISNTGSLLFSSFLGGSGSDSCNGLTVTPDGSVIAVGSTTSPDLPLKNAIRTDLAFGINAPFLTKLDPNGQLMTSTLFGGSNNAYASAVTTDSGGNILVGGFAGPGFPTKNAIQTQGSAFLLKFDSALKIIFSTYLGGTNGDLIDSLAVDAAGNILFLGLTHSADFPGKNALQPFRGGGLSNTDAMVGKLSASGQTLIYATPFGGSGDEWAYKLALDAAGNVYIAGYSKSLADYTLSKAFQKGYGGGRWDGILLKLSDATVIEPSPLTISGGNVAFRIQSNGSTSPQSRTVSSTPAGLPFNVSTSVDWLVASVNSRVTPANVTVSANAAGLAPGSYTGSVRLVPSAGFTTTIDVTLTVLAPPAVLASIDPTLVPIGSSNQRVTINGSGFGPGSAIVINGAPWTLSPVQIVDTSTLQLTLPENYFSVEYNHTIAVQNPNAPLSNVLSLAVGKPAPSFTAASTVNAASFTGGPVAPGEIITIFGANLEGNVTFDYVPAKVIYTSPTQMSVTVPYFVVGQSTALRIGTSAPVQLTVAPSAPGIFAAVRGDSGIVTLYGTGCGVLSKDDLPTCVLPVSVSVNEQAAEVLYAGIAPGLPEGVNQINLRLPIGVDAGPLRVIVTAGEVSSKEYTLP